jgi:hypothetical protein
MLESASPAVSRTRTRKSKLACLVMYLTDSAALNKP